MKEEFKQRSMDIFKDLVDAYVETGDPVGSRTLSKRIQGRNLSSATIRNVMADLEDLGFLSAPHTSAGRIPTPKGLRFYVTMLLEGQNDNHEIDQETIDTISHTNQSSTVVDLLSGLSGHAGIVMAPKSDCVLEHVEFVGLSTSKVLVILTSKDGSVENRIIDTTISITQDGLDQTSRYLSHHLRGYRLSEIRSRVLDELLESKTELHSKVASLIESGVAVWGGDQKTLIVKGQSQLLSQINHMDDLAHVTKLFKLLEEKESLCKLLDGAIQGDGIQIFIGCENELFNVSGCALIVSPFKNAHSQKVIGAVGVIGPSHMAYGRIIPLVQYTAKALSSKKDPVS